MPRGDVDLEVRRPVRRLRQRNGERELGTLAHSALHTDPAAVHLYDLASDGEPEPGADDLPGVLVLEAFVTAEQPADELGRDAPPVVEHADQRLGSVEAGGDAD